MKLVEVVAAERSSAGGAGGDHRGRRADGPHPDPRQGQPRLRRQPPRPPLLAGVAADARRRRRRRRHDRPRRPPRRRLPHGPVRAARPDRPRRQPRDRPLLLPPGRRAGALAPEPDPGRAGRRRHASGARAATATTSTARGTSASRTPTSGSRPRPSTPSSWRKIDPAAEAILPRLFAQIANEAAFAREEEIASPEDMETAMRLGFNWPLGPLGDRRADRPAPRGRAARPARAPRTARPTGRRRGCGPKRRRPP